MNVDALRKLLEAVADGKLAPSQALGELRDLPYADLGHAKVDHHRTLRQGLPEVIYGEGKTAGQIASIAAAIAGSGVPLLVTRLDADKVDPLAEVVPGGTYHPLSRTFSLRPAGLAPPTVRGRVLVVSAGTSDLPVAEEAVVTLQTAGHPLEAIHDVGVAGIHRLLSQRHALREAAVIIAVAGMEGALPTVVAGLVEVPVVAVPTSVGYGAALHGLTPLLSMLTSCAPNVAVVNVDNGFGAATFAATINGT